MYFFGVLAFQVGLTEFKLQSQQQQKKHKRDRRKKEKEKYIVSIVS
jgi:hypothetical protein